MLYGHQHTNMTKIVNPYQKTAIWVRQFIYSCSFVFLNKNVSDPDAPVIHREK